LATGDSTSPETGIVTGWGLTNEDFKVGVKPNILQSADVPLWDNEECQTSYKNLLKSNKITENQMCAGAREGGVDCENEEAKTFKAPMLTFLKFSQLVGQTPVDLW
jgi:hypothetical protein